MGMKDPKNARQKGIARKRRRHRAERREATQDIRIAHNTQMRAEGHPGWTQPRSLQDLFTSL